MFTTSASRKIGRGRAGRMAVAAALAVAVTVGGCVAEEDGSAEFGLVVHPEFVQGMYSDTPVTVLVTVDDEGAGSRPVTLGADFSHGSVTVAPERVSVGEIAEVTVVAQPVVDDVEATLTVTGTREGHESSTDRQIVVMPGADDRESTARDLLAVFGAWLEENRPGLGVTSTTAFEGRVVAPRLLVVSHYLFENDDYELGLSWHVMVAPDDWSELYLRPRDTLTPVQAFRLSSWSTALAGEAVEVTQVDPPTEIVR